MADVMIHGATIDEADFLKMEAAGAAIVGTCNSFVYFFNSDGNEIAHFHTDLYPFVGLMVHPTPRVWDASIKAGVNVSSFPSHAECFIYSPGDRVQTAHGMGTVQGFEQFHQNGSQMSDTATDNGGRVRVALDNPEKWPCHNIGDGSYYAFRSDLVKGDV